MNKKGFMFIETIIMCAILMVALLLIYNGYTSSITKEKLKLNYNTTIGEIKLYYLKQFMIGELDWKCESVNSCPIVEDYLKSKDYEINYGKYSEAGYYMLVNDNDLGSLHDVASIYGINGRYYLQSCNTTGATFSNIEGYLGDYLKTLKECDTMYRIVAEFYDNDTSKYSYAWIEYPYVEE